MLVELAVGDAYGAAFEYVPASVVAEHNDVTGYCRHPTHAGIAPGNYTDDTQMTLALAELLVDGAEWTPATIAAKFVEVFQRDPRVGYASRFQGFLQATRTGPEFLANIRPDSDKSGAAMRVSPAGLLPSVALVREYAAVQARVTHDTPGGIASAEAAALAVHYCHHELGPLRDVAAWISGQTGVDWTRPWSGKVGPKGEMAVRAALTALAPATSMRALLHACVAFTGDVDTVATIALAAASRSPEVTDDLPMALIKNLERGTYGFPYLYDLDRRLLSAMSPPVTDPAQLLGTWSDDALYLGAMECESVTFAADGTGFHLWENVAEQDRTPFRWSLTAPGRVRVDDEVRVARIGPGSTATGDRTTILTLGDARYGR